MKIKQLEWHLSEDIKLAKCYVSNNFFGDHNYKIAIWEDGTCSLYLMDYGRLCEGEFIELKKHAQLHFENLVKECMENE